MKKENLKRIAKRITAFAAAAAMAATFTFPAEVGDGFFDGFGNAIVASAADHREGGYTIATDDPNCYTVVDSLNSEGQSDGHKYIIMNPNANVTISGSDTKYTIRVPENATNVRITLNNCSVLKEAESWKNAIELLSGSSTNITLEGTNNIQAGRESSAIRVAERASLSIYGPGSLNASINNSGSAAYSAVIGSQYKCSYGNISIYGGTINANSNSSQAAAIGTASWESSEGTSNGTIALNGGTINANIIGGITTSANCTVTGSGAAIVNSSDINANTSSFNGIVFNNNAGTVYGNAVVDEILEISADMKLTIPEGTSLSVTNSGSLNVSGVIILNGTIENNGTIDGSGKIIGEPAKLSGTGNSSITPVQCRHSRNNFSYIQVNESQHKVICSDCGNEVRTENHDPNVNNICAKCGYGCKKCGDNVFYYLDSSGTLTIFGTGSIYGDREFMNDSQLHNEWMNLMSSVKKIIIESGITGIGDDAFSMFNNAESISIPNTVTTIGNMIFPHSSTALQEIVIPESVTNIGRMALSGLSSTVVMLPQDLISSVSIYDAKSVVGYKTQTVDGEEKAVVLSVSNGNAVIPQTICSKEVYLADDVLKDYPDVNHDHREKTAATCTDKAVCAICLQEYGSTLPHTLSKVEAADPTCTAKGNAEYWTCDDCSKLFSNENGTNETTLDDVTIPALGHSLNKVEAFDPTCTAKGNAEYWTCDNCSKLFSDENGLNETTLDNVTLPVDNTAHLWSTAWENDEDYHWHKCLNTGCTATNDKAEHSSNAAATEESSEVCKDCDYVMAPALGHIHKNHLTFVDRAEPADCTTDGTEAHYECDCGKLFADDQAATEVTADDLKIAAHHSYGTEWVSDNDDNHYHVCSVCGDKTDITAHSYDNGVITTEPTEQTTGIKTYTCSVCDHTKTEVISKLDHTHIPSDEYSKDETGHWHACSGCDEKLDLAAHNYGKWKITVPATSQANGKKERSCTVCGYVQEGTVIYGGDESTGDIDNATNPEDNALHADLELTDEDIINKIPLTPDELEAIENGADLEVYMVVIDYSGNVPSADKALAEAVLTDGMKIGMYIDVTLFVKVGDNDPRAVTNTNGELKITFEMPEKLINTDKNTTRKYSIIRVHNGEAAILDCAYDKTTAKGSFVTDKFSTYSIAYKDITEGKPAPVVRYPIVINGNVTVDKTTAAAGETVNVRTDFGYDIIVTAANGQRIAQITEKGSFKMPACKVSVTAVQNETFALMSTAWRNSYVYSYDADMNKIKVNSTKKRGVIVIDLGEEYADKSFTIYSGRKSTKVKVTDGVLDAKGRFTFEVPDGKNYTLVVED